MFEHFYMTGVGIAGYVMFCVPLALLATWLVYWYGLRRLSNPILRWAGVLLTAGFLFTLPLWDVIAIGLQANKLCREQAGLKVYRTVEAEGFLGDKSYLNHGFSYMEDIGLKGNKYRYIIQGKKIISKEIPEFSSRYQSKTGDNHIVIGKYFSRSSAQVIDVQTREVLGELVYFSIYPGWLDNIAIALTGTGSGFSPWLCGNEPLPGQKNKSGLVELIKATIKPKKASEGEMK